MEIVVLILLCFGNLGMAFSWKSKTMLYLHIWVSGWAFGLFWEIVGM